VYKQANIDLAWSYQRHWRMAASVTTWSSLAHSALSRCFSLSRSCRQLGSAYISFTYWMILVVLLEFYKLLIAATHRRWRQP